LSSERLVLEFVDRQIVEALSYHLRQLGVTFRLAEKVTRVRIDSVRDRVVAELESGKKVQGESLVYASDLNQDASVGQAAKLLREASLRDGVGLPHCVRGLHADCPMEASCTLRAARKLAACYLTGTVTLTS
jgi:phytoene dehydrogenase-like protein